MSHDHHSHEGSCADLAEKVSEYIDEELPPELRQLVEDHLNSCVNCEKFVESLRRTRDLAHLLPALEIPPDRMHELAEAVKRRLAD
jgi:anti-sigma factor RsiW